MFFNTSAVSGSSSTGSVTINFIPSVVPEPASLVMIAGGLAPAGLFAWRRRRLA